MNINIYKSNYDQLLKQNKIRWKLFIKKTTYTILLYALIGLLILLVSFVGLKKDESYWGFTTSFGFALILLSVFYFIHFYQNRTKYFDKSKQLLSKYRNQNAGVEIKINDIDICYRDIDTYYEVKWSAFSQYKIYDDYIFLIMEELYLNSIIIDRNDIAEPEFNQLHEFIKSKLKERK